VVPRIQAIFGNPSIARKTKFAQNNARISKALFGFQEKYESFTSYSMLPRWRDLAKARVDAIFSPMHEESMEQPPALESAELVAAAAQAAAAAVAAQTAVSVACDACTAPHATSVEAEYSEVEPEHGVKRQHSGGPRGHYVRKSKALKTEFRQILHTEGRKEAIASVVSEGVPENTARGWSTAEELAKPLPLDGNNRSGSGRK
jgi:hypothetical protein